MGHSSDLAPDQMVDAQRAKVLSPGGILTSVHPAEAERRIAGDPTAAELDSFGRGAFDDRGWKETL